MACCMAASDGRVVSRNGEGGDGAALDGCSRVSEGKQPFDSCILPFVPGPMMDFKTCW